MGGQSWLRHPLALLFTAAILAALAGCGGGGPSRYDPALPPAPTGLAVTETGDGRVTLAWTPVSGAAAYGVYAGVEGAAPARLGTTTSSTYVATGLTNDLLWRFAVTSVNSTGESVLSGGVAARPAVPGPFSQSDVAGGRSWAVYALAGGGAPGWAAARLTADESGAAVLSSYADSAGNSSPVEDFWSSLLVNPTGQVRDSDASPDYRGVLSTSRDLIVAASTRSDRPPRLAVLVRHDPGVVFSNDDIKGFGSAGGGSRRFAHSQLTAGPEVGWEFGLGQSGQDRAVQYPLTFLSSSGAPTPGRKATILGVNADGLLTESRVEAVSPQPAITITRGTLSDDKALFATVETDLSAATPAYVLRVGQVVNNVFGDATVLGLSDLAGTFAFRGLALGVADRNIEGTLSIDENGLATFSSYSDSLGVSVPPTPFAVLIDADGVLSSPDDGSFHGKLGKFKGTLVWTSELAGESRMFVGVR